MLQPGTLLGGYRLLARLGAGGMGEVWRGEDTSLGRAVAVKVLPAAIASDPEAIARMKREARTAAQIYHPNIATIHAFEEAEGRKYIVMELVSGVPLSELISRGPLPEAEICGIGKCVADALAEAHAKGIVHRDIKPDNIMVDGPRVKVLDFGIAKKIATQPSDEEDPTAFLTQQGFIIGTVQYMSPEQALGKTVDGRSDLFSLGVVLYQAATGRLPFRGETATETLTRIVRDEPEPPYGASSGLAAVIQRCLKKERGDRYASAAELSAALERQLAVAPTLRGRTVPMTAVQPAGRRRTAIAAAGALLLVAIAAVMAGLAMQRDKDEAAKSEVVVPAQTPAPAATPASSTATVTAAEVTTEAAIIEEKTDTRAPATTTIEAGAPPPPAAERPVPTSVAPPKAEPNAEDLYRQGLALLLARRPLAARELFQAVVKEDPGHAGAHLRLAEMALFMREFPEARRELEAAMAEPARLTERDRKVAELGLAIIERDRPRAEELYRELTAGGRNPELERFRQLMADRPLRPRPRPRRGQPR